MEKTIYKSSETPEVETNKVEEQKVNISEAQKDLIADTLFEEEKQLNQEKDQLKIDEIKNEIKNMDFGGVDNNSIDKKEYKTEQMGETEKNISNKLLSLIEGAKTEEDKIVFQEMIKKIEDIKNRLQVDRKRFEEKTGYTPTRENMIKYSDKWYSKDMGNDTTLKDTLKNGEKVQVSATRVCDIDKLSVSQQKSLFEALGFEANTKMSNIVDLYNEKYKKFFEKKVVLHNGKSHLLLVPTGVDGVYVHSVNFGDNDNSPLSGHSFSSLILGKKFIEDVFQEEV